MTAPTAHQGGMLKSSSARALAPSPTRRNDTGAKREGSPAGVKTPNVRRVLTPSEVSRRKWVLEITERKGTVEDLLTAAIQRVVDHQTEEGLLEAQAIINELARTGQHSAVLHKLLVAEQFRRVVGKEK
jgi:hypothetical protein